MIENTNEPEVSTMKKYKSILTAGMCMTALVLAACGGASQPAAPEKETAQESETAAGTEEDVPTETQMETETVAESEAAADYSEAYAAYKAVLEARGDELSAVYWQNEYGYGWEDDVQSKYGKEPVALVNICGDETPELIFTATQTQYSGELNIYTYADGQAKCIFSDDEWDIQVAGGTRYCLFQTEDDDTLHAYTSMGDEYWEYKYFTLTPGDDGQLVPGKTYIKSTQPSEDYEDMIEEYSLDGEGITADEFDSAINSLLNNMRTVVLCSNIDTQQFYESSLRADYLAMDVQTALSLLGGDAEGTGAAADATEDNLFAVLADQFSFASGAGGWSTELMISDDGSFTGDYHDSDMGDSGDDYPNGTVYVCSFSGRFGDVKKINDTTYSMHLKEISLDNEVGDEWIEDGVRYVASEPYGLDNADEIMVYLEGTPTADLPEEFISWIAMPRAWGEDIPEVLPCQGLYNVAGQEGFSGE